MPYTNTKYNYVTQLQNDLSENCVSKNFLISCSNETFEKYYLTNKASYLIHPFSKVSNNMTKFSQNQKPIFKYKKPSRVPIDLSSSLFPTYTQKNIQNQVKVPSSSYTMNLASLNVSKEITINNKIWNNSSDRVYDYKNSKKDNKDEDEDEDSDDEDESKTEPSAKEVVKSAKKKQEDDDEDEEKNEENLEVKETFVSMSDLDRLFKTDSIKNTLDSTSEKIKSFM